jgi:hypothetical protein
MPKRNKQEPLKDVSHLSHRLFKLSTSNEGGDIQPPTKAQISMLMAELGRRGGKIGGKRRMKTMTAKERTDIARKAAAARWKNKNV